MSFDPMYPDVLGAISGGKRIDMGKLQCALGVFPKQTYINQPVEVVLILQNMVDQSMQVKVAIQLPSEDKKGNLVVIDAPKKMVTLGLRPGEVGVLRIPIVPHPPTQPGTGFPVRVAVRYRTPEGGQMVRPVAGGAPPSVLSITPVKLQVLRDVEFAAQPWKNSVEQLTTFFDIAPKRVPLAPRDLKLRYETLWTHEEMKKERPLVRAQIEAARRVAAGMTRTSVYRPILNAITERFAEREMPLHPGEAQAIAKMMTYTLDEGMELEWGQDTVEQSRWFQSLCQVLAHDESVEEWDRGEIAVAYLLEAVLYDAILLGFTVIEPKIREDLGDLDERINYANRLLTWFASHGEPDLSYVYLPLVMGGVVVNQFITLRDENPWVMLEELREAYAGRIRLVTDTTQILFDMLEDLLADAEETLRRMRIPPPG